MPTVDFTLEDIAKQTEGIVERALVKERGSTRSMVQEVVSGEFMSLWEHNLSPVLENMEDRLETVESRLGKVEDRLVSVEGEVHEMKHDMKSVGRLVAQHSKDIMALRAREA